MSKRNLLSPRYAKFLAYMVVVVLLNCVGLSLFFKWDLTANKIYSLSDASRESVVTLTEPLTVKVFFTQNLPAPHNSTERYLRDLLAEYADAGDAYFNYRFYNVSPSQGDMDAETRENQTLAANYGIQPIQIKAIEKDQVKFRKAYMGLVIIHGDQLEKIPAITTTDGLEYKLTMIIRRLNNKVSALLALKDKIQVNLYLSSSLKTVAPLMQIDRLADLPERVERIIGQLNQSCYDKLEFTHLDPSTEAGLEESMTDYQLLKLKWPELDNGRIRAGTGTIGLVLLYAGRSVTIPLLQVAQVPVAGTRYRLADLDNLSEVINANIESLIGINEELGILTDFGSLAMTSRSSSSPLGRAPKAATTFSALASQNYTLSPVKLRDGKIPDALNCLVIPAPKEKFSEFDLFLIDQFLMKGKSLAVIIDPLKEIASNNPDFQMAGVNFGYLPLETGLEKLLSHYGVSVQPSIIMDEACYRQQLPKEMGGGDLPIYFAPLIKKQNINDALAYMHNVNGLIAAKASPIRLDLERIGAGGLTAHSLIRSSEKSWEMKDHIQLNPRMLKPPGPEAERQSFHLACMIEGAFPSYFAGKPIPEKPKPATSDSTAEALHRDQESHPEADAPPAMARIEGIPEVIEKGKPGKLFVLASSEMMQNALLDASGRGSNSMFLMNVLDYLNNRPEIAAMRSKQQRFVPLDETRAFTKTLVKTINIVGLPVAVVVFGLLVWFTRHHRKKRIQAMFSSQERSAMRVGAET